jgi:hypothetical protein
MFIRVPKSSSFPEIDFASKCIQPPAPENTVAGLLYPLSNAETDSITEGFAGTKFFVGKPHEGTDGHIPLLMESQSQTDVGAVD